MKLPVFFRLLIPVITMAGSCRVSHNHLTDLSSTNWIHGSKDCSLNTDPPIQVVQVNYNTFILRQNKCSNYEAPFLFLFLGKKKVLLMDTGATEDEARFPLYETIKKITDKWQQETHRQTELVVAHTHAHGDHVAGDFQFKDKPNTTVVGTKPENVISFFKLQNWPFENAVIDLGDRKLEIIPIPGHEPSSVAVYDTETKILLSGDSFYPGRLYVRDWLSYTKSMQRLTEFAETHPVSYILGNHIEMTRQPGIDYPTGTTFQPAEHQLPLHIKELRLLNKVLQRAGDTPTRTVLADFIVSPK